MQSLGRLSFHPIGFTTKDSYSASSVKVKSGTVISMVVSNSMR
jgi:hypothetical protein